MKKWEKEVADGLAPQAIHLAAEETTIPPSEEKKMIIEEDDDYDDDCSENGEQWNYEFSD